MPLENDIPEPSSPVTHDDSNEDHDQQLDSDNKGNVTNNDNLTKPLLIDENTTRTSSMTSNVSRHSKKSSIGINIYKTNTRPLSVHSSSDLNLSSPRANSHSRNPSSNLNLVEPASTPKDHSRTTSISEQLTQSLNELTMELSSNHSKDLNNDEDEDDDVAEGYMNDDEKDSTMSAIQRIKSKQDIIKQMANESRSNSSNKLANIITHDLDHHNESVMGSNSNDVELVTPLSNPLTPLDRELPTPTTITSTDFHTTAATTTNANIPESNIIGTTNTTTVPQVSINTGDTTDDDEDRKNYRNSVWLAYDKFIDHSDDNLTGDGSVSKDQSLPHSVSDDFLKSGITDDEFLSDDFHYDSNSPLKSNSPSKETMKPQDDGSDVDSITGTKRSIFLNPDNFKNSSNSTMNVVSEDNATTSGSRHNVGSGSDSDDDEIYSYKERGDDEGHELEPVESSGSLSTGRYSRKSSFVNNTMTSSINNRTMSSSEDHDHDENSSDDYEYNETHSDSTGGDLEAERREMFIRKNTMQTIRPDQAATPASSSSSLPKYGFNSDGPSSTTPPYPLNTPPIRKYSSLLSSFNESSELSQAAKDRAASLTTTEGIPSATSNGGVPNINASNSSPINSGTFGTSRNFSGASAMSTSTATSIQTATTATTATSQSKQPKTVIFVSNDIVPGCNIIQITSTKFSTSSEKRRAEIMKYRRAIDEYDTGLDQWLRHTSSSSTTQAQTNSMDLKPIVSESGPNVKKAYSNISSSNQLHHHQYVSPSILTNSSQEIATEIAHDLKRTTSKVKGYFRKIKNSKF